jgi:hydroxymethylbilane synthase
MRIGTRGSPLALAQTELVAALLRQAWPELELETVVIVTRGDKYGEGAGPPAPPASPTPGSPDDKERWVAEIEQALLDRRIDLAVHSAKDLPGALPAGTVLLGGPARADPRDALCGAASLEALPEGARVGTGSLRRAAQLRALREDLDVVPLRGNVQTRLRRREERGLAAAVLAAAGLDRLDLGAEATLRMDPQTMTPAPGQGMLGLQARAADAHTAEHVSAVCDKTASRALRAERALMAALGASCHTPVGGLALPHGESELALSAFAGLPDGSEWCRDRLTGPADAPEALGASVAARMLAAGAGELLARATAEALA